MIDGCSNFYKHLPIPYQKILQIDNDLQKRLFLNEDLIVWNTADQIIQYFAMTLNGYNQNQNPALKTKMGII